MLFYAINALIVFRLRLFLENREFSRQLLTTMKSSEKPFELIRISLDKARLFSIFERSLASVVIIPIPLSPKRLRQRGYNQSELIGHFLSDRLSVRMKADILIKIKDTPSQVEIKDRKERLKNLQGAFAVKNPEEIKDKIVILVDDIITTGATLNEAKKVLKQAGAGKVFGVAAAG